MELCYDVHHTNLATRDFLCLVAILQGELYTDSVAHSERPYLQISSIDDAILRC